MNRGQHRAQKVAASRQNCVQAGRLVTCEQRESDKTGQDRWRKPPCAWCVPVHRYAQNIPDSETQCFCGGPEVERQDCGAVRCRDRGSRRGPWNRCQRQANIAAQTHVEPATKRRRLCRTGPDGTASRIGAAISGVAYALSLNNTPDASNTRLTIVERPSNARPKRRQGARAREKIAITCGSQARPPGVFRAGRRQALRRARLFCRATASTRWQRPARRSTDEVRVPRRATRRDSSPQMLSPSGSRWCGRAEGSVADATTVQFRDKCVPAERGNVFIMM